MSLPDIDHPAYPELLEAFERELTYSFGGCKLMSRLEERYLSEDGNVMRGRVNVLYADTPFRTHANWDLLTEYLESLMLATMDALNEEAVTITAIRVYHTD